MKIRIPHLIARGAYYYWQPSSRLRSAGWQNQRLGTSLPEAMKLAEEWNRRVADWRAGRRTPDAKLSKKQLKKYAAAGTVRQMIDDFRAEHFDALAPSTRKSYGWALGVIDQWAGDQSPRFITRDRCVVLLKNIARPETPAGVERLHRASGVGRVLRTLLQWAKTAGVIDHNPMNDVRIRTAPPRTAVWQDRAIEAMVDMADAMGMASIGTATLLAADTGQREGDLLKLSRTHLRTGKQEDGSMGAWLRLRQGKTNVWVDVLLTERLIERLAAQAAAPAARAAAAAGDGGRAKIASTVILTREADGKPYRQEYFIRDFAEVRAAAIKGSEEHGLAPCPELEGLQYRDLRRTLVVRLAEAEVDLPGIAAITGHQIEECKKILEVYLPRTTKMATAAIKRLEAHRTCAKAPPADAESARRV